MITNEEYMFRALVLYYNPGIHQIMVITEPFFARRGVGHRYTPLVDNVMDTYSVDPAISGTPGLYDITFNGMVVATDIDITLYDYLQAF